MTADGDDETPVATPDAEALHRAWNGPFRIPTEELTEFAARNAPAVALYAPLLQALAERLRMHHHRRDDDTDIEPPLAARARELAHKLLLVGYFPKAPRAYVDDAQRLARHARDLGYGAKPWQEDLKTALILELARAKRDEKGFLEKPLAFVRVVLTTLRLIAPELPDVLKKPPEDDILGAAATFKTMRVRGAYEKGAKAPGRNTVQIHGAMKRFAEAFGLEVPAFEKDTRRKRTGG